MELTRECLVSLDTTSYYHCVARCVRRAALYGRNDRTGRGFEQLQQWFEDKVLSLVKVFSLDVCAYAAMSKHQHVVMHIKVAQAADWQTCLYHYQPSKPKSPATPGCTACSLF